MALNATIAKSFKELVATDSRLASLLPGDLHYGRADTSATRPFGSFTVEEKSREYESGYGAFVQYELTLRVYGKQLIGDVGTILEGFASAINRGAWRPLVAASLWLHSDSDIGTGSTVLSIMPTGSTLTADETEEFGKDVMVGQSTWMIYVNEYEQILV